jgi:phosphoenolpyruvate carboxykinase (GTP)
VPTIPSADSIKRVVSSDIFNDKHLRQLPAHVREYVLKNINLCKPDNVYLCNGSEEENQHLVDQMVNNGVIEKLDKYENW